jgi:large subunit ribosomal protein L4
MAAPKAPLLDKTGKKSKDVTLEAAVFGAELKAHLVHEAVRAEQNAARQGTRGAKSRGMVSGGRAKPWRQKGTGRARAGTTRAAQWTGGGVVFPPGPRNFELKVNRKARKAAFRMALSNHADNGTLALVDGGVFDAPSTKQALALMGAWGKEAPLLVVATEAEESVIKSFRNLPRTIVTVPTELEVTALVWASSLIVTEAALEAVQAKGQLAEKEVSA